MYIVNNSTVFSEDPIHHLGFEKFESDVDTKNLILHLDAPKNTNTFNPDFKHILIDLELPNRFAEPSQRGECLVNESRYDKILTICPETVRLRNSFLKKDLYVYVPFPVCRDHFDQIPNKDIDIIYSGNSIYWLPWLKRHCEGVKGTSYTQKLGKIKRSKISLVHNEFIFNDRHIQGFKDWSLSPDCVELRSSNRASQFKSRVVEAALSKSLLLCKKDDFNIIEDYFTKDSFVYFENEDDLNSKVDDILNNYEQYKAMIDSAYNCALTHRTTEAVYSKVIKSLIF